jgi:hypothetical protein
MEIQIEEVGKYIFRNIPIKQFLEALNEYTFNIKSINSEKKFNPETNDRKILLLEEMFSLNNIINESLTHQRDYKLQILNLITNEGIDNQIRRHLIKCASEINKSVNYKPHNQNLIDNE